jgi:hypothetical protein
VWPSLHVLTSLAAESLSHDERRPGFLPMAKPPAL